MNPERVPTDPASAAAIALVPVPDAVIDLVAAASGEASAAAVAPDIPYNPSSQV